MLRVFFLERSFFCVLVLLILNPNFVLMIQKIGIIGSGKMGLDIFNYLSEYNFAIVWHILLDEDLEKHKKGFLKKLNRKKKHGLLSDEEFNKKSNYILTNNLSDFGGCDLIIESIVEDEDVKKKVFAELESYVSSECIFVSNSSSIYPWKLQNKIPVYGMHFFYPVAFKNTVEIIAETESDQRVELLKTFIKNIDKTEFIQNRETAFLLNRFLLLLQIESLNIKNKYNLSFEVFDAISKQIIPDFGLFEMMDHVGHKTMFKSIQNYSALDNDQRNFQPLLKILEECIDNNKNLIDETVSLGKNEIESEVLLELDQIIQRSFKMYCDEFGLGRRLFASSIDDFCGLEIEI